MQGSLSSPTPSVTQRPAGPTITGRFGLEASTSLVRVDVAVHEWLGLIAYWLTGRIDALLPGSGT